VGAVPTGLVVAGVAYGLLFAAWQGFWVVAGLRSARSRDERLGATGAAVPGAAGRLIAAAALTAPAPLSVGPAILAVPVVLVGRAVDELVVFRPRRQRPDAEPGAAVDGPAKPGPPLSRVVRRAAGRRVGVPRSG
jgi:hypothetical protein